MAKAHNAITKLERKDTFLRLLKICFTFTREFSVAVVTACASGNKGGTGKTVVASLLAYHLSELEKRKVLLVDMGEGGSSTLLLLERDPGPPYLNDYFYGRASWSEVIVESPLSPNLLVAPSAGEIGPVDATALEYLIERASGHVDHVVIDLPAYPGSLYDPIVSLAQIIVAVFNPDALSFEAVRLWLRERGWFGKKLVLPLLNKFVALLRDWKERAEDEYGSVYLLPFEAAFLFSVTRNIADAYDEASTKARKDIEVLAYRVERPLVRVTA